MKKYRWAIITLTVVVLLLASCEFGPTEAEKRAREQEIQIEMDKRAAEATREAIATMTAEAQAGQDAETARGTRLIMVTGSAEITDDEFLDDEHATLRMNGQCTLTQDNPTYTFPTFYECAGGEVRVEIDLSVTLRSDNSVDVSGTAQLFEGTSCNTTDREDSQSISGTVVEGGYRTWEGQLLSRGTGGGDSADIKFTIENRQQ